MLRILVLLSISTICFAQNVKVQDYQVPISQAQYMTFTGNWNWSQLGDSVTSNVANANLFYRTFYSSLPLAWFINADAVGFSNRSQSGYQLYLQGRINKYIWPNADPFAFSELNASYADTSKQLASDITVGFGYGRYINATSLAKAVRIEDHLMRDKLISDYLPKETILAVANIIERQAEFEVIYGELYETYWLQEIENEIQKSGVLVEDKVGAIGVLRMQQVLFNINERVNQRYYGWDVTAGILFPISTQDKSPVGKPNLSIGGRYSIPASWAFQVNAFARIYTPLDSSFAKKLTASLETNFIYEFSNTINFVTNYTIGAVKPEKEMTVVTHTLGTSFWFYLENNIYLTISGNYQKFGSSNAVLSSNVGLQYYVF